MKDGLFFCDEHKTELSHGSYLYYCNTDQYKRSGLDIFFTLPMDKYNSPLIRLMFAVICRGSKNFPTITHISKHLDNLYDSSFYTRDYRIGANHVFRLSCYTIDNKYLPQKHKDLDLIAESFKVVRDILTCPLLDSQGLLTKKYVESEREFTIDNIRARLNSPKAYSSIRCSEMLFGDQIEGTNIEGTEELLRNYTREEITAAREYFLKNSAIDVYYVGTHTSERVAEIVRPLFEDIGERTPILPAQKRPVSPVTLSQKQEEFNLSQGILKLGLTCGTVIGDRDSAAILLYNEILGGSAASKLFVKVREENSLCYYCDSRIDMCTGALIISCGIKPENKDRALESILLQIEEMKRGNITDEEIQCAKKSIVNGLNQVTDTVSALSLSDFRYRILTDKPISVEQRKKDILAVTRKQLTEVAEKVNLCSVFFLTSSETQDATQYDTEDFDDE
ncbi:MAG: insulinase family protein [Ruminococcaceae bacterium]|nr:insulinase family protein [Oscillospiraceae bacterium]